MLLCCECDYFFHQLKSEFPQIVHIFYTNFWAWGSHTRQGRSISFVLLLFIFTFSVKFLFNLNLFLLISNLYDKILKKVFTYNYNTYFWMENFKMKRKRPNHIFFAQTQNNLCRKCEESQENLTLLYFGLLLHWWKNVTFLIVRVFKIIKDIVGMTNRTKKFAQVLYTG